MVRVDKVITVQSKICRKVASLNTTKLDEVLRKTTAFNSENYAAHKFNTTAFVPGTTVIPPSGKVLGVEEPKNMVEASLDGNLTRQPYMISANFRIRGNLTNTDNVLNNTFWIGVQPALTEEMLEFAAQKIEAFLAENC